MLKLYIIMCIAHLFVVLVGVYNNPIHTKYERQTLVLSAVIATLCLPWTLWGYTYYWWQGAKVDENR